MNTWTEPQRRMLAAMGYTLYQRPAPAPASPASATGPEAAGAAAVPAASGEYARLREALRRAAGGRDIDAALLGDLDGLRRDPQRKRLLWPHLRALRRTH